MDLEKVIRQAMRSSRLQKSEEAISKTMQKMERIIDAFNIIKEVDVQGIEPLYLPTEDELSSQEMRADESRDQLPPEQVVEQAPETEKNLFLLPK